MINTKDKLFEKYLLDELKRGKEEAFEWIFKSWYTDLVLYAGMFIPEKPKCEDIAQTLFMKIWEERETLRIETSLKAYLVRAVRNSCLDELKHREVMRTYEEKHKLLLTEIPNAEDYTLYSDLAGHLQTALEQLPPLVKETFELNRFGGLKYKEIAQKQGVSERSIEVRIGKALQFLRQHLKEYLVVGFIMLKLVSALW
ncbi:RNA polymerase sigma-70 factor [Bacteroides sp. OttesenSCG-928-N06]|nr:RNA polymerase sigma-70 factor [Bacteroides sp. OttesenSCG-928-N06]